MAPVTVAFSHNNVNVNVIWRILDRLLRLKIWSSRILSQSFWSLLFAPSGTGCPGSQAQKGPSQHLLAMALKLVRPVIEPGMQSMCFATKPWPMAQVSCFTEQWNILQSNVAMCHSLKQKQISKECYFTFVNEHCAQSTKGILTWETKAILLPEGIQIISMM